MEWWEALWRQVRGTGVRELSGGGGVWRPGGEAGWWTVRESKKSRSVVAVVGNSSTSRGSPLSLGDD